MEVIAQRNIGVALIGAALLLAACGSAPIRTGLGAPPGAFHAHHDARYSDVLTGDRGTVDGYILSVPAQPLAAVEALVKRDLPGDAAIGPARRVVGIEGTTCDIVHFSSAALGKLLGGKRGTDVMAVFQTQAAVTLDTARISHAVVISGNENRPEQC